ncbi:MAG: TrbI/VirB10 family protein [Wolbachia sp.]|nr:TrbI/VirB10 family protein [Wolbachia sp.]MDD9336057.1 TrbI/VirB10 family protein [Wolbachia sp.]
MNRDNFEGRNNLTTESEIESKVVTVGSNQGHRALVVVVIMLLVGVIYYFYFSSSDKEDSEATNKAEVKQNMYELKEKLEQVPDNIPVMPERVINNPLPPLPSITMPQVIPEVKQIKKEEVKKEEVKKEGKPKEISAMPILPNQNITSNNFSTNFPTSFPTIGSSGYPKDRRGTQMLAISGSTDSENKAADMILSNTSAQSSKATKVGRLDLMITQGKIIDAVLETAISSDLQGVLRAVVSRDVYAEAGDTVLIPKGSRLIGGYTLDSNVAKARVNINWNRVILPHGIDVPIASSGIDELGRAGIAGMVDNKVVSALFSSVALAGVSIGAAIVGQKASNLVDSLTIMDAVKSITAVEIDISPLIDTKDISKDKLRLGLRAIGKIQDASSEQELLKTFIDEIEALGVGVDTSSITLEDVKTLLKQIQKKNKSVYESEIEKSIGDFSKDMRDIIDRHTDKKPTIYVNQGTALKVFVNQDIVFPPQAILYR